MAMRLVTIVIMEQLNLTAFLLSKTFNPISCNSGTYNNYLTFTQNFKEACKKEGKHFIKDKKSTSTLSLVLLLLKQSSNLVKYRPNMIIRSKYMMGISGP
jgi:hypothetical protein